MIWESATVLKDAGATAMYGSKANTRVIIVTKKVGPGKTNHEAKVITGFRTLKMLIILKERVSSIVGKQFQQEIKRWNIKREHS